MVHTTSSRAYSENTRTSARSSSTSSANLRSQARRNASADRQLTSSSGASSDPSAPVIGHIKISLTEADDGTSSRYQAGSRRSTSQSRYSLAGRPTGSLRSLSADRFGSSPNVSQLGTGRGDYDHDFVVGYATVKTQTRPANSESVQYKAFVGPTHRSSVAASSPVSSTSNKRQSRYSKTYSTKSYDDFSLPSTSLRSYRTSPNINLQPRPYVSGTAYHTYKYIPSPTPAVSHIWDRPTATTPQSDRSKATTHQPDIDTYDTLRRYRASSSFIPWAPWESEEESYASRIARSTSMPHLHYTSLPTGTSLKSCNYALPHESTNHVNTSQKVIDRIVAGHVSKADEFDVEQKIREIRQQAAAQKTTPRRYYEDEDDIKLRSYEHRLLHLPDILHRRVTENYTLPHTTAVPTLRYVKGTVVTNGNDFFHPSDVSETLLPNGKKAMTYTKSSQTGHGDHSEANTEIEKIIRRTRYLQDSMHTLEQFINRNRSLFPADILIYQYVKFYLLSREELVKLGENPDAELYGAKIREKLVVPYGCEIVDFLKRYYSRYKEVEVEYDDIERIRLRGMATEQSDDQSKDSIRKVVEAEYDERHQLRQHPPKTRQSTEITSSYTPSRCPKEVEIYAPSIKEAKYRDLLFEALETTGLKKIDENRGAENGGEVNLQIPQFSSKLRPRRIAEGNTVRLSCAVSSIPDSTVTWYHDNRPISNDLRHHISVSGFHGHHGRTDARTHACTDGRTDGRTVPFDIKSAAFLFKTRALKLYLKLH